MGSAAPLILSTENVPVKNSVGKPTISVVGAGRLGSALALALADSGHQILALVTRHSSKDKDLVSRIGSSTLSLTATELDQLPQSDVILISTPDDAIWETAVNLSKLTRDSQNATVLHTSGAFSSTLLAPLAELGYHTGSIHPLVSVSDPANGPDRLRGAFYCVEGDEVAVRISRGLVEALGGNSFSIPRDKKALYHAAAVMSSGHVTALFDIALEMLGLCGVSNAEATKILLPLLQSAVSNLESSSPAQALTGTFARGDLGTADEHIAALQGEQLRDARSAYKLLGKRSLEIAKRRGLDPAALDHLRKALDQIDE